MSFLHAPRTFLAVARGEARLALADAPGVAWRLLAVAGWAFLAILMGLTVGFAAVALPPMALLGIIALFVIVLLWVLPEGPTPSDRLMRRVIFVMLAVDLTIPTYYTYQIQGLPWISMRRMVTLIVIVLFSIVFSASRQARKVVSDVIKRNRAIFFCSFGYLFMASISIITSINPGVSMSGLSDVVLEWYVPFVAVVFIIRSEEDIVTLLKLVLSCAIFVSIIGVVDFIFAQHTYMMLMPKSLLESLAANNPTESFSLSLAFRNGLARAPSVFSNSLSFAEFESLVAPVAVVFVLHGRSFSERAFGAVVVVACLAGVFVSGSRGGYLSLIAASVTLAPLFVVRCRVSQPQGMAAPIAGVLGAAGFSLATLAILFIGRVRGLLTAGGTGAASDAGRKLQWVMAWPKILANPITGYGLGQSGEAVGYRSSPGSILSVDSFVLTLITETGVPGLLIYFGMLFVSVFTGARQYVRDQTFGGALSGGLASSLSAYTAYRLFLSQRENQTLVYIMIACVALLSYFYQLAHERPSVNTARPSSSEKSKTNQVKARGTIAAAT